jgi:hypothetical protein
MSLLGAIGPRAAAALRRSGRPSVDRVATWLERQSLTFTAPTHPGGNAAAELSQIVRVRAAQRVKVREPLVLITQVHRSGGTLLLRLLDAHAQLHVVPHELGPLVPERAIPFDADRAWELLYDPKLPARFRRGLRQQERRLNDDDSRAGFVLPPLVHRELYDKFVDGKPLTERRLVDAYFTAYFNAWLDYRGLRDGKKLWVAGFEPLLITQARRLERFWRIYPDGRLITILRDPAAWWASARRWAPRFEQMEVALPLWRSSALAAEQQLADERVLGLLFENLVERPEETMHAVADFLGIGFDSGLLVPSSNGVPFGANSSFASLRPGQVEPEPAERASELTDAERATIEVEVGDFYERVRLLIEARLRCRT